MAIPLGMAKRLAVWRQCFSGTRTPEGILETIAKLGCIQIDTINVVERSHYTVLWSRIGNYEKEGLDRLLYPDRKVFEFWAHAASIIPMDHYRFFIRPMKESRRGLEARAAKRLPGKAHILGDVLGEIRKNGPMCSSDFEQGGKTTRRKRSGWWSWKPEKVALEMLFNAGVLMVTYRENFQRYYDLTENVLPSDVDLKEPTAEERRRFFVERAFGAAGIAGHGDISSYYYDWCTRTSLRGGGTGEVIGQMLNDGILEKVTIRGLRGQYYVLSGDLDVVGKIAKGDIHFDGVTFLSPFDNLTWFRNRTRELFNFTPRLEAYFPGKNREFGYYNMNILYGDRLVGRLDPKVHRDLNMLEIKSLHFEKGFKPTMDFREKFTDAILSFMRFNGARDLRYGKMVPRDIKTSLSNMRLGLR